MFNCEWVHSLTCYECRPLKGLDGGVCLEIGTPFSLADGSAINLYLTQAWSAGQIKISDNADTLFHLGGMGLDVWNTRRRSALEKILSRHGMHLGKQGEAYLLANQALAALAFARAISGFLALSAWASGQLKTPAGQEVNMLAQMEPHIVARNPAAVYRRNPRVRGASRMEYTFDVQHGVDLIDVISPNAQSTGAAMRKAGDIQNGPFAENLLPLFVVYDLNADERERAMTEMSILGSSTRAITASRLMQSRH